MATARVSSGSRYCHKCAFKVVSLSFKCCPSCGTKLHVEEVTRSEEPLAAYHLRPSSSSIASSSSSSRITTPRPNYQPSRHSVDQKSKIPTFQNFKGRKEAEGETHCDSSWVLARQEYCETGREPASEGFTYCYFRRYSFRSNKEAQGLQ